MRRAGAVLVSATCLGVLVTGCAADTSDLPGLTASPTVAVTVSPSASPTGIVESSDPDLGIVFDDVPDLTGDEADVYNWIATYEKAYWSTMTTNQVSTDFSLLASAEVQARMQQIAAQNVGIAAEIGGVIRVEVREIAVDGDSARAVACVDYSEATFADPDGTYTPDEAGFGGTFRESLTLARLATEDRWMIMTTEVEATC